MADKTAADLMIPIEEYPWVGPDAPLRDAMALLDAPRFDIVASSGSLSVPWVVLVIDDHQMVGMLRRRDMIRGLGPWAARRARKEGKQHLFPIQLDPEVLELSRPAVAKSFRERASTPVRDHMLPVETTVDHDESIDKVIEQMVIHDVSLVPVLEGGRVVGVMSSVDVFYEVSRIVLGGEDAP
jgi:CBS domain-containing protein